MNFVNISFSLTSDMVVRKVIALIVVNKCVLSYFAL